MDSFLKSAEQKFGGEGTNQNDLAKQAEGFVSSESGSGEKQSSPATAGEGKGEAAAAQAPASGASAEQKSQGHADITGNAKTLYQGIQDKVSGKTDVDNAQLAGAADGLLSAAKTSGLDKDGQYTDYFNKAEGFLQKYQGGSGTGAAPKSDAPKESAPPNE